MSTEWLDEEDLSPKSLFESNEFQKYRKRIVALLKRTKRALCTRDIHLALGRFAFVPWTMDALEQSNDVIELLSPILPCRYVYSTHYDKIIEQINQARRKDNNDLFANNETLKQRNAVLPFGLWEGRRDK